MKSYPVPTNMRVVFPFESVYFPAFVPVRLHGNLFSDPSNSVVVNRTSQCVHPRLFFNQTSVSPFSLK